MLSTADESVADSLAMLPTADDPLAMLSTADESVDDLLAMLFTADESG